MTADKPVPSPPFNIRLIELLLTVWMIAIVAGIAKYTMNVDEFVMMWVIGVIVLYVILGSVCAWVEINRRDVQSAKDRLIMLMCGWGMIIGILCLISGIGLSCFYLVEENIDKASVKHGLLGAALLIGGVTLLRIAHRRFSSKARRHDG